MTAYGIMLPDFLDLVGFIVMKLIIEKLYFKFAPNVNESQL